MNAAALHALGSQLEAAATFAPGQPIKMDPLHIARALMAAARQIEELQK